MKEEGTSLLVPKRRGSSPTYLVTIEHQTGSDRGAHPQSCSNRSSGGSLLPAQRNEQQVVGLQSEVFRLSVQQRLQIDRNFRTGLAARNRTHDFGVSRIGEAVESFRE